MNKLWVVVSFFTGLAVGSIATYQLMKVSHEQLLQEEIESIKNEYCGGNTEEYFPTYEHDKLNVDNSHFGKIDDEIDDFVDREYEKVKNNYRKYTSKYSTSQSDSDSDSNSDFVDIQIITPEEYGEDEGYDRKELHFDIQTGKVVTSDGEEVEDVDSLIGPAALSTFGLYEDDAVHVKNNTTKCYYEILKTV